MKTSERLPDSENTELNLLAYARVVWKHWRLVGGILGGTLAVVLVLSLLSTRMYVSTATILAPSETRGGGMSSLLAASALLPSISGVTSASLTPNRDVFLCILKSRSMAEEAVKRFDLAKVLRCRNAGDAILRLQESVNISLTKEGVFSIKAEIPDAQLVAIVANFYCEHLDRMLARLSTGEANKQRTFIEERLKQTLQELEKNENALMRFQEMHKAIALQEQTKGAVEAAAKVRGQIVAAEVQLEVLRNYATETNPEVISMRLRVEELKKQIVGMRYGKEWEITAKDGSPKLICEGMPVQVVYTEFAELGLELARLTREVKVQEAVYALLTQQLEQAKIAEAKDVPTVQVLDAAVPPDHSSKPKILANMVLGAFASFLVAICAAFVVEYAKGRRRSAAPPAKLELLLTP